MAPGPASIGTNALGRLVHVSFFARATRRTASAVKRVPGHSNQGRQDTLMADAVEYSQDEGKEAEHGLATRKRGTAR